LAIREEILLWPLDVAPDLFIPEIRHPWIRTAVQGLYTIVVKCPEIASFRQLPTAICDRTFMFWSGRE
jgi:hypothetical protein